ncbi:hypothetical protein [Specibacter cremeus]|uniref:hypothetical protein n=1 Tax=Specibacter cremeus TaxID=1629051 RepID=UPI000F7A6144|nr:hypothetical protein [Specibacter cremeus]
MSIGAAFTRQSGPAWSFEILTPGRSLYPVIVSLTPPTALNQDPAGKPFIARGKDAPTAKHCDA